MIIRVVRIIVILALVWSLEGDLRVLAQARAGLSAPSLAAADKLLGEIVAVTGGGAHTCALTSGGGVKCWGSNYWGQLGDGTFIDRQMPVDVVGLKSGVAAVVAGGIHTCALTTRGGVKCWGGNFVGQLGDETYINRARPVDVIGLSSGVETLALGEYHTCALISSGGVKCWGYNSWGQLGNGSSGFGSPTPVNVLGLDRGVTAITAGADHTCAAMQGGGAMCWGGNAYGDLGIGEYGSAFTATDVVNLTEEVLFLAADGYYTDYDQAYGHTCAALASGQVKCWGVNWGSGDYSLSPVIIGGLTGTMLALEAGDTFTCAVTSGGKVKCWGRNDYGQLGDGTMIDRNLPADVIGLESNVSGLGLGDLYACVVTELGNIYCWGGSFNRLGTGDSAFRPVPLPLKGLAEEASQLAAGFRQACVVSEAGGVKCWGWNWGPMPSQVSGLTSGVLAISVSSEYPVGYGSRSACAVMETGSLECWDGIGQPYSLDDLFDEAVTAVAVASRHKCALTINGGVKCWGKNEYGQLGDGTTEERISPVDVSGLTSGVAAIATGGWQSCALLESGQVKCWGNNDSGQLGDGTDKNRVLPVDVIGLSSGVAAITSGDEHTCALIESGGVKCWGNNDYGQLGDGTTNSRLTPVDVIGLTSGVQSISAGYQHTCALMGNGGVKCWGNNSHSQLGDGTTSMHLVPTDVRGLTANVIALEASGNFTCAILTSRGVKCWGENSFGQLSQGTANIQLWPAPVLSTRIYVALNENIGRPGSYFTVWGEGFPPYRLASVIVNGTVLTDTLQTGTTGSFIFFLDTAGADTGAYNVTVTAEMNTAASFILLEEQADLRPQEGGGIILPLHAGIVQPADLHFLPFVRR